MKRFRKTGRGLLGAVDKIKKPTARILLIAGAITAFSFASADDLTEARVKNEMFNSTSELKSELNEWENIGEFKVTAYCSCEKCCGVWAENRPNGVVYTASGEKAEAGKTIAVDTSVIPFGTEVKIGDVIYTAQDTGSAVKGNVIDVYYDSHEEALNHGAKYQKVEVRA
nr:MAG TPA: lytic transglycosylase [Caudoviricetes sp.]